MKESAMRLSSKVVAVVVFVLATSITLAQGPPPHSQGVQKLMADTQGKAKIRVDKESGEAKFVRLPANSLPSSMITNKAAKAEERAKAFVAEYGNAFGADKPDTDLKIAGKKRDGHGGEHAILKQTYEDIPVFGGELRAHFDEGGDLTAVNGTFVSGIKIETTPGLTAEQAAGRAIRAIVTQQAKEHLASSSADGATGSFSTNDFEQGYSDLSAASTRLLVFRAGLVRGTPGADHLAYEVEVRNADLTVREFVYVDAKSGAVIDQITGIHDALHRRAYDGAFLPSVPPSYPGSPFWVEGDALPTGVAEADNMIYASKETYDLFFNAFGRDSFDDLGAMMDSIFNRGYGCPNASWNGVFISFCNGFTTDDVTGHEWGHAYTQYTNNLIYQWQSGALSESYSDIWGETVDLINGRGSDAPGGLRSDGACSIYNTGVSTDDNSYRWLMGEDVTPGGALRDMWNPNCEGDPGKVSDPEYWCTTGDNGGVHFNSGVPNHAFALMVDGGNYNGYSGPGIGLIKAAHIHYAAQLMLTPASNFVDHADALEAACTNLTGVDLNDLLTGAPSGELITASDCTQVSEIITAVELRTPPTQCEFEPLLQADAPALCEGFGTVQTVVLEDFEGGLPAGWTASSHDVANPSTFDNPGWSVVGALPGGNSSSNAAFAPDLIVGNCADDTEAGAVALDSPPIALAVGAPPHVAFDHWVATETGWDGGNLKVSVNGGPWTLVPGSAYSFNAYNGAINNPNDNPLAGEEAFTGANEGSLSGSWGQSQVDLFGLALPGDTIQLRYDLGLDGCNGATGWYVDNVHVYSCSDEPLPVCGDGLLDFGEMCDDGNSNDGDGCSSACAVEAGWICEDPQPSNPGGSNVVADWSFEGGVPNADWTPFSTFGGLSGFPLCGSGNGCPAASLANTGTWLVWVGGLSAGVTSSVEQTITIPAAATDLTLYALRGRCDDPGDTLHVSLDGTDIGTVVCSATDGNWVQQTFPVAPFNDGGSHTLLIGGTVGGTNGTHSNFFVDDVVLNDNTPTAGTPSYCTPKVEDLSCNAGIVVFDEGIANSWVTTDDAGFGLTWSNVAGSGENGNYTGGDGDAASVSSDSFGPADFDTSLVSNSFSLAYATEATLSYLVNYQNFAAFDLLDVDVSVDGGATWDNLLSWNEDHGGFRAPPGEAVTLDLSAYLGQPEVRIRWRYYDPTDFDWDWYAQVDNIALDCDQTGQMNGGGIIVDGDGTQYSHGFELYCLDGAGPNNLQINWGEGRDSQRFKLTELTTAICGDRPGIDEGDPDVGFDTFIGAGTGTLNNEPASITFRITDAGEPGTADAIEFAISGPDGVSVSSVLVQGNHQAVRE
jgi:cysteine-rich repeat protein